MKQSAEVDADGAITNGTADDDLQLEPRHWDNIAQVLVILSFVLLFQF